MQYAITFNSKTEFDKAYNKLNQAGLIGETPQAQQAYKVPQMEEIPGKKEEPKESKQQTDDVETVRTVFSEAHKYDVIAAIVIMKEYEVDKDEAKAIKALKEITKS